MKTTEVQVGEYTFARGVEVIWVDGFQIDAKIKGNEVYIRGNAAGLKSLAQQLLTLADESTPVGSHIHLYSGQELEDDALNLTMERGKDNLSD
jgi:hypothetical protein